MHTFLNFLAWAFGAIALLRFLVCGYYAWNENRLVLQQAYYYACGKAFLFLVVCVAWLIARPLAP